MIRVTLVNGDYAGETRVIPSDISPESLLGSFLEYGWEWSIDYSQATEEEIFEWARQDMSCRILRALKEGRSVRFLDKEFRLKTGWSSKELIKVTVEVETMVTNSDRIVSIEYDDETGVGIKDNGRVS